MASDAPDDSSSAPAGRSFWEPRASPDESESEDEESDPSSIADVFTEMLSVNEDMVLAIADCHANSDIDGSLAYQRILHRNLMEMANYVDSMFGPPAPQAPLTPEAMFELFSKALEKMHAPPPAADSQDESESSALLKTLEADEHFRTLKRSNKLWMKSRHLVREEESVSAIMNATAEKIAAIAVDARDSALQQQAENGEDEDAEGEEEKDEEDDDEDGGDEDADDNDALDSSPGLAATRQVVGSTPAVVAALAAEPPAPAAPGMTGVHAQLNAVGLMNLLAPEMLQRQVPPLGVLLPPAQLDLATLAAMGMAWGPLLQPRSRQAIPPTWAFSAAAAAAQRKSFGRVCAECQKLHLSLHTCRVLKQHTAPEWGTRRKRRNGESKSGKA